MVKLLCKENGASLYEMQDGDIRLRVTDYGASVFSVDIKNSADEYEPIVLTCESLAQFMKNGAFFGATVGRTANRIKEGSFTLGGKKYSLTKNEGRNSAHGGKLGFAERMWSAETAEDGSVEFTLLSADGEEGYPGNLRAQVNYSLKNGCIRICHRAVSDADTIVSFTNHTYWCLGGLDKKVYDEQLFVNASEYLETDAELIPTGQVLSVKKTPFDFTCPHTLGERINSGHPSIQLNRGYDVSFVRRDREPGLAARLFDPEKERTLEVYTSYPDIHLYTGNFLNGVPGVGGRSFHRHDALCLEGSMFPDAINHPCFSRIVLKKGEEYNEFIEFRISRK